MTTLGRQRRAASRPLPDSSYARAQRHSVALAGGGRPSLTAKDAASAAIDQWCDAVADQYLRGDEFLADGGVPTCSVTMTIRLHRSSALAMSSTPRVTLPRDVTGIGGPTLERARQAVEVLRQSEDPELGLMGFVDAVVRLIVEGGDSLSRAPVVELVTALYR
jgi:hypothetical protein